MFTHRSSTLFGTYPATPSLLEWLGERLDGTNYSTFKYFFARRGLLSLADKVITGEISRKAANRILKRYNDQTGQSLCIDELIDTDDTFVFSPAGDWIIYSDDMHGLLRSAGEDENLEPLEALASGLGARWVVLYQVGRDEIHALKTPYTERKAPNPEADRFAFALSAGPEETFVLPPEVHGNLKQELGG